MFATHRSATGLTAFFPQNFDQWGDLVTRLTVIGTICVWAILHSPPVAHAEFNPDSQQVQMSTDFPGLSFDGPDDFQNFGPILGLRANLTETQLNPLNFLVSSSQALEGKGMLQFSDQLRGLLISLDHFPEHFRSQRIEMRFWYQPHGTYPIADLIYLGATNDNNETFVRAYGSPVAEVRFIPTGKATSDGWVELSTGPVDVQLTAGVHARVIQILDAKLTHGRSANRRVLEGFHLVDALEIIDHGPVQFGGEVSCNRAKEAEVCGDGLCLWGRCVDPVPVLGTVPHNKVRNDYLGRQVFRLQAFAGSRRLQEILQTSGGSTLQRLKKESKAIPYWTQLRHTYDQLQDGHIKEPEWNSRASNPPGACIHLGEVDLLSEEPSQGYLVYRTDDQHPVGKLLLPGDVLIEIDNLPIDDWLQLASRDLRYSGDSRGRKFILAPQLLVAALQSGSLLSFKRCPIPSGCTEDDTETIIIDTSEHIASLREGQRPGWFTSSSLRCDFRFASSISQNANNHTGIAGPGRVQAADEDNIRTLLINDLLATGEWLEDLNRALTDIPTNVILDQRSGRGGSLSGVLRISAPFMSRGFQPQVHIIPWIIEPEFQPQDFDTLLQCATEPVAQCGNYIQFTFQDPIIEARSPSTKMAILNGLDVSANDYLTKLLKARTTGNTRVFGAVPTYGAFGPIYQLPRLINEDSGGSIQLQDTLFHSTAKSSPLDFLTGRGIEPDEVILQRQSDALSNNDTLVQAARNWLQGSQ
ncbi:MAG: hypothetical protein KTR25_01675 [Myxococcales bacterium]|nr:hypothetical protein [Myxococcales bacterium]